jgi:Stage III sporulation protein AF (Spore_III_AF).
MAGRLKCFGGEEKMQEILAMVQKVTVFLLVSTLVMDFFSGTEYKKYLQYVVSLIVIVLVISPFFKLMDKGIDLRQWKDITIQEGTSHEDGGN